MANEYIVHDFIDRTLVLALKFVFSVFLFVRKYSSNIFDVNSGGFIILDNSNNNYCNGNGHKEQQPDKEKHW